MKIKSFILLFVVLISFVFIACEVIVPISVAEGGVVDYNNGKVKITIPEGAAISGDSSVSITITQSTEIPSFENGSMGSPVYEFGPDGLEFSEPVEVEFKLGAVVGEWKVANIVTFNEESGEWENVENQKGRISCGIGEIITAEISHFSKYAIEIQDDIVAYHYSYLYNNPIMFSSEATGYEMTNQEEIIGPFEKMVQFNMDNTLVCKHFDENCNVTEEFQASWRLKVLCMVVVIPEVLIMSGLLYISQLIIRMF